MSQTTTISAITERYHTLKLKVNDGGRNQLPGPIEYTGSFDHFKSIDLTTAIGREYSSELQLTDLINADEKTLRDFAAIGT